VAFMSVFWDKDKKSGLAIPKAIKRISPPRGVPKTREPRRRDNPQKAQYRRYSDAERAEWERKAQLQNLAYKSEAVESLCAALRSLGIDHRREEKVVAFGNTYFIDVWCPALRIAFEADGAQHRNTRPRDRGRDEDISKALNCRVVRKWNSLYLKPGLRDRILQIIGEDEKHAFS
jgi:very-short-patch-repair endonuclease